MAQQKKGCGFLITALILLIIGSIVAFIGIKGAVDSATDFASLNEFKPPAEGKITAEETEAVTLWLVSKEKATPVDYKIEVKDTKTGALVAAQMPNGAATINDRKLLGSFAAEKGKDYTVGVTGLPDDSTVSISSISPDAALGIVGKGLGGILGAGICGFLALIFGIIGLVKFLGSKKAAPPTQTPAPPAV